MLHMFVYISCPEKQAHKLSFMLQCSWNFTWRRKEAIWRVSHCQQKTQSRNWEWLQLQQLPSRGGNLCKRVCFHWHCYFKGFCTWASQRNNLWSDCWLPSSCIKCFDRAINKIESQWKKNIIMLYWLDLLFWKQNLLSKHAARLSGFSYTLLFWHKVAKSIKT